MKQLSSASRVHVRSSRRATSTAAQGCGRGREGTNTGMKTGVKSERAARWTAQV